MDAVNPRGVTEHSVVYTDDIRRRMTRQFFGFVLTRARTIIFLVALAVAFAAWALWVDAAWPLAVVPLTWAVFLISLRRTVSRQMRTFVAPDSTISTRFGPDTLIVRTPTTTAEMAYQTFTRVHERGGVVFLQQRNSRIFNVLPIELCSPADLALIRGRLGLS